MDIDFRVVLREVDESYPEGLSPTEIAVYISEKKASAFDEPINNELIITADTIVSVEDEILGKPKDKHHAFEILSKISGRKHEVITAVSLLNNHILNSFYEVSEVYFGELSPKEIRYYIETAKPFDKAGAYGIQEWIGLIGIERINGSYTNVVGLPTERLYRELQRYQINS
jgi:septum formation protein